LNNKSIFIQWVFQGFSKRFPEFFFVLLGMILADVKMTFKGHS